MTTRIDERAEPKRTRMVRVRVARGRPATDKQDFQPTKSLVQFRPRPLDFLLYSIELYGPRALSARFTFSSCSMAASATRSNLFLLTLFLSALAALSILAHHQSLDLARDRQQQRVVIWKPRRKLKLDDQQEPKLLARWPPPPSPSADSDRGCPSIFVYDPPPSMTQPLHLGHLFLQSYGTQLPGTLSTGEPYLYDSDQHGLGALILERVLNPQNKRCRHVHDPSHADLFLVPLVFPPQRPAADEMGKVFDFMPPSALEQLWHVCSRFVEQRGVPSFDWLAALPHLSDATARRHVLVPLQHFELFGFCMGADPGWSLALERNRSVANLLSRVATVWQGPMGAQRGQDFGMRGLYARLPMHTAPLVSSVHLRPPKKLAPAATTHLPADPELLPRPPWSVRPTGARPYLMSYGGSTEGSTKSSALRRLLVRKCQEYGNRTCALVTRHTMAAADALVHAFHAKARSVFCLEPPGFGDHRKSQVDALTLGCIPVLFTPWSDQGLWATHWGSWRDDSRVLLDLDEVLDGNIDVREVLEAIPTARVRRMQQSIARYAHRMHYGVGDTPGDALEVLLNELSDRANDADSGTTARGEIVRVRRQTHPLDRPEPLPSDCVDKAIEPRLLQHVPAQIVKQLEARDAIGSPKAQCDVLLAMMASEQQQLGQAGARSSSGPGDGGAEGGHPALSRSCSEAKLAKARLVQLYVSDVCARSCGICTSPSTPDLEYTFER